MRIDRYVNPRYITPEQALQDVENSRCILMKNTIDTKGMLPSIVTDFMCVILAVLVFNGLANVCKFVYKLITKKPIYPKEMRSAIQFIAHVSIGMVISIVVGYFYNTGGLT